MYYEKTGFKDILASLKIKNLKSLSTRCNVPYKVANTNIDFSKKQS